MFKQVDDVMKMRWTITVLCFAVALLLPALSYAQFDAASLARSQRQNQLNGGNMNDPFGQGQYGQPGQPGEMTDGAMQEPPMFIHKTLSSISLP